MIDKLKRIVTGRDGFNSVLFDGFLLTIALYFFNNATTDIFRYFCAFSGFTLAITVIRTSVMNVVVERKE